VGVTTDAAADRIRNIRIVLAYDGTPYLGWQVQPQGPTVQSVLQDALHRLTGERAFVKGSGRTDAGVHALGQVANFRTAVRMTPESFAPALNSVLPPAISVLASDEVGADFDAQFSTVGKLYRYRVFHSRSRSPFEHRRSWQIPHRLDIESMSCSASMLLGTNDFSSFRGSGCSARSPVRELRRCDVYQQDGLICFDLEADGFLRHMVRNVVGTLVDVGRGRLSPGAIADVLAARDRAAAGRTAPAHGLYLVKVDYPPGCAGAGRRRSGPPGAGAGDDCA
jgi:tRNA pseudouridine38-40 synthase